MSYCIRLRTLTQLYIACKPRWCNCTLDVTIGAITKVVLIQCEIIPHGPLVSPAPTGYARSSEAVFLKQNSRT